MYHSIIFFHSKDNIEYPKNLFDKDHANIITAFPHPQTGVLTVNQSYGDKAKSVIIAVKPNTDYTIQIGKISNVFLRVAEYSSYPEVGNTGRLLSTLATFSTYSSYGTTFTTSTTAAYVVWYFSWDATSSILQTKLNSMMLELGSDISEYVPYGFVPSSNQKNTWEDWHIVPSSRPVFNPPALKKNDIPIPGGNGSIDMSEALTGYPLFDNSTGSFEFIVMNDYLPWQETYSMISDYLHGKKLCAILEDDPCYYREGRFTVNKWKSDKNYSCITVDYSVSPYKVMIEDAIMEFDGTTVTCAFFLKSQFYGTMPTVPTLTVNVTANKGATIRFVNKKLRISFSSRVTSRTYLFPELVLYGDHCELYITADNESLTLEDSSGNSLLDSNNNVLSAEPSAHITLTCKKGGLG